MNWPLPPLRSRRSRPALIAALLGGALVCPAAFPASGVVVETVHAALLASDERFRELPRWTVPGRPTVALALSGGGARGLAHVGVLQGLAQEGIGIDAIAGTSMGALVGAFASAGLEPEEIAETLRSRDWNSIVTGFDLRHSELSRPEDVARRSAQLRLRRRPRGRVQVGGLYPARLLERELQRHLLRGQALAGDDFNRLRYRFRAVATDVRRGRVTAVGSGDLVAAVRGSSAMPGLLAPVPFGDALLVDGGLLQNVPVETARELGTDLVLAVDVSERVGNEPELDGVVALLSRSLDIMMEASTRRSTESADLLLTPKVEDFPRGDFRKHLDLLVERGRQAVVDRRDDIWRALDARAPTEEPLRFDRLEVSGAGLSVEELVARFGTRGSVSRYLVRAHLARVLNQESVSEAHAELVDTGDERILRFVVEGGARPLAEGRRVAWQRRLELAEEGRVLARLEDGAWNGETGELSGRWTDLPVREVAAHATGSPELSWTNRRVAKLKGDRFDWDRLTWRLDDLVVRGAVRDWSLLPRRLPDGDLALDIDLRADGYDELSVGGAFRGDLRWAGLLRVGRTNLTGRGDALHLTLTGAEEVAAVDVRYQSASALGLRTLGFEIGGRWFDSEFPSVDDGQRYRDGLGEGSDGGRAWSALVHRPAPGRSLLLGLFHERRRFPTPSRPRAERSVRTSLFLRFDLDGQDRLLFPTRGGSLQVRGESALGGESLHRLELGGSWARALNASARTVLIPRAGLGLSHGAERRSFWFDPGGHRSLYGFVPYGAAAPQYVRAGLRLRQRIAQAGPVSLHFELGADVLRLALDRADLDEANDLVGVGLSFIAHAEPLGPIALGWARNDEGADILFVTAGYSFLGN